MMFRESQPLHVSYTVSRYVTCWTIRLPDGLHEQSRSQLTVADKLVPTADGDHRDERGRTHYPLAHPIYVHHFSRRSTWSAINGRRAHGDEVKVGRCLIHNTSIHGRADMTQRSPGTCSISRTHHPDPICIADLRGWGSAEFYLHTLIHHR